MIARIAAALLLIWIVGFAWFALLLPVPAPSQSTDAVVVLTGGPNRIDRGLEILEAGKAEYMLISGVANEVKPAELAAEYDRPEGLFECCIDLGFRAVDTRSNAVETARWAKRRKVESIRLVTSDWHIRRAMLELGNVLPGDIEILPDAVPTRPSLGTLLREYNKFWLRWLAALVGV